MLPTNPLLNATAPAGPHLPVALLRQYAAGTLAAAAQHRVEAHTLACPRCADVLEGFLQTPPATTDQALAQLQLRLRKRVQQAAPTRHLASPRQHRWLAPQLAAAAALLLGLVAGGWWAWQQRHASPSPFATTELSPRHIPTVAAPAAPAAVSTIPATSTATVSVAASPTPTAPMARLRRHYLAQDQVTYRPLAKHSAKALAEAKETVAAAEAGPAAAASLAISPVALPVAGNPAPGRADSVAPAGGMSGLALRNSSYNAARVRATAMPAPPALAPSPVGGTAALRELLRREATEFVPEAGEPRLAGTVQLRLTIGADGKIQQITVLRGLRTDYDAEAQRLLCEGPAWVPGIGGGRRAAQVIDVAIPF